MLENLEQERIVSLRRTIQQKRKTLGLEVDLLELKSLKKYAFLDQLSYPDKVMNDYPYHFKGSIFFLEPDYFSSKTISKHNYVFKKLIEAIVKKIQFDVQSKADASLAEVVETVRQYIKTETGLSALTVEEATSAEIELTTRVFLERTKGKLNPTKIFKYVTTIADKTNDYCTTLEDVIPKRLISTWTLRRTGESVSINDLSTILATATLYKVVADFLFESKERWQLLIDKLFPLVSFDVERFNAFTKEEFLGILEKNRFDTPDFIQSVIVLTFEEMLRDRLEIQELESRLTALSSGYAKTYMTKKNIPLKIQRFMENNQFLNMFGEVEADELCDLEKLQKLSEEFVTLSKQMYLPTAKNHSLRFRRLGHHKAAGIYYPCFNTLAVDIDSPRSFIHELFHLIDFENNLLSVGDDFKPLLIQYRALLDDTVNQLGKDHPTYQSWYKGKSKYSRGYYTSKEEAFARMGELYVSEILQINSSFNEKQRNSEMEKLVYPTDANLLKEIEHYFNQLFERLKKHQPAVVFETPNVQITVPQMSMKQTTPSKPKEKVKPIETFNVIEQLSLGI